jgi:HEAT repeat protein
MKTRNVISIAACASVVAGVWLGYRWISGTSAPPAAQDAAGDTPPATAALPSPVAAPIGLEGVTLDGRYRVLSEAGISGLGATKTTVLLTGELEVDPVATTAGTTVRLRLVSPVLSVDGPGRTEIGTFSGEAGQSDLSLPFSAELDGRGTVRQVRFDPKTPQALRPVLQSLVTSSQLSRPVERGVRSWSATETDSGQTFTADYAVGSDRLVHKTWHARVSGGGLAAGNSAPLTNIFETEGEAQYAVFGNTVVGVRATLRTTFDPSMTGSKAISATGHLSLDRIGDTPDAIATDTSQHEPYDATTAFAGRTQEVIDREATAGRSYEQIVAVIEQMAAPDRWQMRKAATADLEALLRLQPAESAKAAKALRAGAKEPTRRSLIEALAGAGTEPAQRHMVALMRDPAVNAETHAQLELVAPFVESPRPFYIDEIEAQSRVSREEDKGDRGRALVALGGVIATLKRDRSPETAARTERFMERAKAYFAAARASGTPRPDTIEADPLTLTPPQGNDWEATTDWLAALGNTGSEAIVPLVRQALQSNDDWIRGEAIEALRFIHTPITYDLTRKVALHDPSDIVRHKAMITARYMGPEQMLQTVKHVLATDRFDHVRSYAAFAISVWAQTTPGLVIHLQEQLQREHSDRVKEVLHSFIEPGYGEEINPNGPPSLEGVPIVSADGPYPGQSLGGPFVGEPKEALPQGESTGGSSLAEEGNP